MPDRLQAISEFWTAFVDRKGELATAESADHSVYEFLLSRLQRVDPGLYFEFSSNVGCPEVIITADGNRSLFPLVDMAVTHAPTIEEWSVYSLKPRIGFPATATWEGFTVAIADVVFEPLQNEESKDLGIRMFLRGLAAESTEDAHNALLWALDHGLGERRFAELVSYTDVHPLPVDADLDRYLALTQLEDYLRWREQNQRGQLQRDAE